MFLIISMLFNDQMISIYKYFIYNNQSQIAVIIVILYIAHIRILYIGLKEKHVGYTRQQTILVELNKSTQPQTG